VIPVVGNRGYETRQSSARKNIISPYGRSLTRRSPSEAGPGRAWSGPCLDPTRRWLRSDRSNYPQLLPHRTKHQNTNTNTGLPVGLLVADVVGGAGQEALDSPEADPRLRTFADVWWTQAENRLHKKREGRGGHSSTVQRGARVGHETRARLRLNKSTRRNGQGPNAIYYGETAASSSSGKNKNYRGAVALLPGQKALDCTATPPAAAAAAATA